MLRVLLLAQAICIVSCSYSWYDLADWEPLNSVYSCGNLSAIISSDTAGVCSLDTSNCNAVTCNYVYNFISYSVKWTYDACNSVFRVTVNNAKAPIIYPNDYSANSVYLHPDSSQTYVQLSSQDYLHDDYMDGSDDYATMVGVATTFRLVQQYSGGIYLGTHQFSSISLAMVGSYVTCPSDSSLYDSSGGTGFSANIGWYISIGVGVFVFALVYAARQRRLQGRPTNLIVMKPASAVMAQPVPIASAPYSPPQQYYTTPTPVVYSPPVVMYSEPLPQYTNQNASAPPISAMPVYSDYYYQQPQYGNTYYEQQGQQ